MSWGFVGLKYLAVSLLHVAVWRLQLAAAEKKSQCLCKGCSNRSLRQSCPTIVAYPGAGQVQKSGR